MAQVSTVDLVKEDQEHLFHPLHHPADHQSPKVWVRGEGVMLWDADGNGYIDGLACLWNVNVGHGRRELAEAAAAQMSELAFCSSYTGATNIPATKLAAKLATLAYPSLNTVYFTSGGAESNESAFKTARFYWKAVGKPDKVKIIARQHAYHRHGALLEDVRTAGGQFSARPGALPVSLRRRQAGGDHRSSGGAGT
jgi:putrescine aminotransferase